MSTLHRLLIRHDHGGNVYYIVDTDAQLKLSCGVSIGETPSKAAMTT